jgi:hypothetical protein
MNLNAYLGGVLSKFELSHFIGICILRSGLTLHIILYVLFQVNMFLVTILMNPPVISALGFRIVNRRLFASVSVYLHAQ